MKPHSKNIGRKTEGGGGGQYTLIARGGIKKCGKMINKRKESSRVGEKEGWPPSEVVAFSTMGEGREKKEVSWKKRLSLEGQREREPAI